MNTPFTKGSTPTSPISYDYKVPWKILFENPEYQRLKDIYRMSRYSMSFALRNNRVFIIGLDELLIYIIEYKDIALIMDFPSEGMAILFDAVEAFIQSQMDTLYSCALDVRLGIV